MILFNYLMLVPTISRKLTIFNDFYLRQFTFAALFSKQSFC